MSERSDDVRGGEPLGRDRARRGAALGRVAARHAARRVATRARMVGRSDAARAMLAERSTIAAAEQLVTVLGGLKGASMKLGNCSRSSTWTLSPTRIENSSEHSSRPSSMPLSQWISHPCAA